MTINQYIRIFAGAFILASLGLAHANGQADLSQMSWLWFTAFVGANLFQVSGNPTAFFRSCAR